MTPEDGTQEGRLVALGHSAALAGYARVFTVIASILGPIMLGGVGWIGDQAWTAFNDQRNKFEEVRRDVAAISATMRADEAAIGGLRDGATRTDDRVRDQERRLSRVEAVVPPIPNPGPPR